MKNENYSKSGIITEVTKSDDGYYVLRGGIGCFLDSKYGIEPKVGQMLTVHTKGGPFGEIRGMDLDGERIFWKTDEDLEAERAEWLRKNEEEKQNKFKENVAKMDATYNSLPDIFKQRIDRFRKNNDNFRVDYEEYELFCCTQAILIAESCKTVDEIDLFHKKTWDEQKKQVPELCDGHSGNTFACACVLAKLYLDKPEFVPKMHGALSPLVGSKEYGDIEKETEI
jgi:hypothetical protein